MKTFSNKSKTFSTQSVTEATEVSVGGTNLNPVPFVSIAFNRHKAGPYTIGGSMALTLNGFIYGSGFSATASALSGMLGYGGQDLVTGINVKCGDTYIIQNGVGHITNIAFDEGPQRNWANIIPYNMQINVFEHNGNFMVDVDPRGWPGIATSANAVGAKGVTAVSETYDITINNESTSSAYYAGVDTKHVKVSFNLSVDGQHPMSSHEPGYSISGINHALMSKLATVIGSTGLIGNMGNYNNTPRLTSLTYNIDEFNNKVSANGELIYFPNGHLNNCLTTITVDHSNSIDSAEKTTTINGTIVGTAAISLPGAPQAGQYYPLGVLGSITGSGDSALGEASALFNSMWHNTGTLHFDQLIGFDSNMSDTQFGQITGNYITTNSSVEPLLINIGGQNNNMMLVSKTSKINHDNNSIDFTFRYSNKKFRIDGALWAEVNIDHEEPARRIVEQVVAGRGYPIVQDIQCDSLETYTISITAQLEPSGDATNFSLLGAANTVINNHAISLGCNGWAITQDTESYSNPGQYKRTKKYTRHYDEI